MRAVVATRQGGPEVLELQEVADPEAGPGEVLVEVRRAGVNFADTTSITGQYHSAPEPPFIPGLEVSGVEVGSGRPVLALVKSGGYAEKVAADRRLVFDAQGLDLDEAGGYALVTLTTFYALEHCARIRPGESVLVHAAAGGIGSTAIQMAKALGAGRVIGVASTEDKRRFALEQGADLAISYEEDAPPVDIVIDTVGGEAFRHALEHVRQLGRMVLLGRSAGPPPEIPGFDELRRLNVGILCFSFGQFRGADPDRVAQTAGAPLELLRSGRVRPPVSQTLPLAGAAEAHRLITGRRTVGKILLAT
jgi:NADPH2:quinone reductase